MKKNEWIECLRKHFAVSCIGNSTLRSQVKSGGNDIARQFLMDNFPLDPLKNMNEVEFQTMLDQKTVLLSQKLIKPNSKEGNWGAARKVINIYLRLCSMNKDVNNYHKLDKIEDYLEIPLDSHVVKEIDKLSKTTHSKNFKIITLENSESVELQKLAKTNATQKALKRYELDILFWNAKKTKNNK